MITESEVYAAEFADHVKPILCCGQVMEVYASTDRAGAIEMTPYRRLTVARACRVCGNHLLTTLAVPAKGLLT